MIQYTHLLYVIARALPEAFQTITNIHSGSLFIVLFSWIASPPARNDESQRGSLFRFAMKGD